MDKKKLTLSLALIAAIAMQPAQAFSWKQITIGAVATAAVGYLSYWGYTKWFSKKTVVQESKYIVIKPKKKINNKSVETVIKIVDKNSPSNLKSYFKQTKNHEDYKKKVRFLLDDEY